MSTNQISYAYILQEMKVKKNTAKVATVAKALDELITSLGVPPTGTKFPAIFVVFDEAHTLTVYQTRANRTPFIELCSALKDVDAVGKGYSFFSFFLSTMSRISKFAMPKDVDDSARMVHEFIPSRPFSDLGFDHLMHEHKIFDEFKTIEDVTSVECVIHMGRPL